MNLPEELDEERLGAYLDGELSSDEVAQVERELAEHAEFRQTLAELQSLRSGLQALRPVRPSEGFDSRVLAAIDEQRASHERAREQRVLPTTRAGREASQVTRRSVWERVAFGLLAVVAVGLIVFVFRPIDDGPRQLASQPRVSPEPSTSGSSPVAGHGRTPTGGRTDSQLVEDTTNNLRVPTGPESQRPDPVPSPVTKPPAGLLVQDERPPEPTPAAISRQLQPDDPAKLDGWLFLVYEVAITPDGAQNDAFGRAMNTSGIRLLQEEFRLGQEQTERLLASGYISGIEPVKPEDRYKHLAKDEVVIVYVMATAKQIDRSYEVLRSMRSEVAAIKTHLVGTDPEMLKEHKQFLKSLHERQNPVAAAGEARRLLSDMLWLTQSSRVFQPISYLPFDGRPLEPQVPPLPVLGVPTGSKLGESMPSEVLFVLHYLNQDLRSPDDESR